MLFVLVLVVRRPVVVVGASVYANTVFIASRYISVIGIRLVYVLHG